MVTGDTGATEGGGAVAKAEEGLEEPYRNDQLNKDEEPTGASKEWLVFIVVGAVTAVAAVRAADTSKDKAREGRERERETLGYVRPPHSVESLPVSRTHLSPSFASLSH